MIENGKLYRHKKTGGFYHCLGNYVAIAKRDPIVGNGQPNDEDGDMWSSYGDSPDEAMTWLLHMLRNWVS